MKEEIIKNWEYFSGVNRKLELVEKKTDYISTSNFLKSTRQEYFAE